MGRKRSPGLVRRPIRKDGSLVEYVYHIDKVVNGQRICESCRTGDLEEAERYLARRMEQLRQVKVYGVRPARTFQEAAIKYLRENLHKRSIADDAGRLKVIMPYIGAIPLDRLHSGVLAEFIRDRQQQGRTAGTINHALKVVRHILNLAATEWMDEHGLTWLPAAPKIKLLADHNKRRPYPLSWDEQDRLFRELPRHLGNMALFAVNTGCRDREICQLRWPWEVVIPELSARVFIIPGELVKNSDDRLVVLNKTAEAVVDSVRGEHAEYVFTYNGHPLYRMLNSAWKAARKRAELPQVRVHDLKHTFGRRLRAAGVSFEDRQDLLGHRSGRITTHYSAPELERLMEASNKVCEMDRRKPGLVVLRRLNVG